MKNTSVWEAEFPLDDLRVEELEPRLEFVTAATECGYIFWQEGCVVCYTDDGGMFACG